MKANDDLTVIADYIIRTRDQGEAIEIARGLFHDEHPTQAAGPLEYGFCWPNGKPVGSEVLPDGRTRHTLEDGRVLTVCAAPTHQLDYLSTWVDAEEDETYPVNVAIAGISDAAEGFFEVWNFDIGELRHYAFDKTARVTDLKTGEIFSGEELECSLRGAAQ